MSRPWLFKLEIQLTNVKQLWNDREVLTIHKYPDFAGHLEDSVANTVLILGARGRLGNALARAFVGAGWQVLGQVRPKAAVPALPGVQWLSLDLGDEAALLRAAQSAGGVDVVVHAVNPPYVRWSDEVLPLMETAIRLSRGLGAKLMFPGNVYNYGERMPAVIDEGSLMQPHTRKGRLRVAAEELMARSHDVPSVIIRAGDFFGNGTGSWFDLALVKDIEQGKLTLTGTLQVATPWAYVPDLARVFVSVATRWQAQPGCLPQHSSLCFAGHQLSGADWLAVLTPLARERGWIAPQGELRVGGMPWGLFRALSFAVPLFRELSEMKYLARTPHSLSSRRLIELVGPPQQTPLPEAVRAALVGLGKI